MKVGELCAGYGGISMGLRLAGEEVDLRWLAEFDPALDPLHPTDVPNLGDITKVDWSTIEPVDLLTAGFPCQPFSAAGSQLAEADPRYLWPAVRDAVAALLPPRVLLENVRNLVSIRKGEIWACILDDLTQLGYDVTWLTLGACAVGAAHHRHRVFALTTHTQWSEPRVQRLDVAECGAPRGSVSLPTPTTGDLLPTPQSRDGQGRGTPNEETAQDRWDSGRRNLDDGLALLPTPTVGDSRNSRNETANRRPGSAPASGGTTLSDVSHGSLWGRFAAAVDCHAAIFGSPPAPTEPNRNGAPRLSAAFAEWLMCIPAGHVTDALPRKDALKAIGNGVCPPQLAQAWRYLTGVDKPNDTSIGFGAMTTSTSADVKEIQDRNAAARGRVIAEAAFYFTEHDVERGVPAAAVEAAMMELAAIWREEAAHVTAAKRKGHVSIAKEYTQAAARLAGFAVGLTTRPIETPAESLAIVDANVRAMMGMTPLKCEACDLDMHRCPGCGEPVNHGVVACASCSTGPHPPQCDCGRPECVALSLDTESTCEHPAEALSVRKDGTTLCTTCQGVIAMGTNFVIPVAMQIAAALPEGDPVAERLSLPGLVTASPVFTSPTGGWSAPTQDQIMGRELAPPLFDDLQTSEEQNLRDIIGPLGASTVTATIDHPFTNPGVPRLNKVRAVEVIPYAELPYVAAATPPRNHVSHSYVESYEGCSLSAMLRDASRAGHIGASRPSWSMIGGNAFHSAVERIERLAVSGVTFLGPDEALWMEHFDAAVKEQMDALVGTPYADSSTWYISNRGKEGFDWWRVEGAKMLGLYVKHHTSEWRAANQTFLLQDKTPVIELPYTMSIRSLDGERGLTAQGFVDRATLDMSTYSLTVLDYKTGSRDPESTFQLGEYGHALLMAMGIPDEPPDRPILGRYWLARKGIYTDAVPVVTRHPLAELQYRYDNADRGQRARIFSPHVTNLCKSCSVTDYCPTQAGRS